MSKDLGDASGPGSSPPVEPASGLDAPHSIPIALTPQERRVLEWIRDNDHTSATWLINGRQPRREGPEKWTHLELRGPLGSIRIPDATVKSTIPYTTAAPSEQRTRLWMLSDAGIAALAQGIEAGTDETRSGSAEGESPVGSADAPEGDRS